MIAEFAEAKGFTVEQIAAFGVRQGARGVEIPYHDANGDDEPRVRLRTAIAAKDGSSWSEGDADLVPYGLDRPIPWVQSYAFIVEGETDCWALWAGEKPALGVPGASNAKCLKLEHVAGANSLYVIREPGVAGARFPHRVADRLYTLGFTGTIFAIDLEDAKDPHELWRRDPDNLEANLRKSMQSREVIERPATEIKSGPQIKSMADLLRKPRKKTEFLVEGILPAGGIMLLSAKPKAGKSVLARNLALSVARGTPFLERECKGGPVVWARLEEPYGNFLDDFETMGGLDVVDRFFSNDEIPALHERMKWLVSIVQQMRPKLVVIDTWGQLTDVDDIGSYPKVNRANEPLMALAREYGVSQIWIHHDGKGEKTGGDQVIGSTALFGACDTLLTVKRYPNDARSVSTIQRFGDDLEETQIVMDHASKTIAVAPGRARIRNGQIEEQIVKMLSESDLAKNDIIERLNFRRTDVLSGLAALEERNVIASSGSGVKGDPNVYSVVIRNRKASVAEPNAVESGTEYTESRNGMRVGAEPNQADLGMETETSLSRMPAHVIANIRVHDSSVSVPGDHPPTGVLGATGTESNNKHHVSPIPEGVTGPGTRLSSLGKLDSGSGSGSDTGTYGRGGRA